VQVLNKFPAVFLAAFFGEPSFGCFTSLSQFRQRNFAGESTTSKSTKTSVYVREPPLPTSVVWMARPRLEQPRLTAQPGQVPEDRDAQGHAPVAGFLHLFLLE